MPTVPRKPRKLFRRHLLPWLALPLAVVVMAAGCAPTASAPGPTTTTTTTTTIPPGPSVFCQIWALRNPKGPNGPIPPERPFVYPLVGDALLRGQEIQQTGSDCTDRSSRIIFTQAEIIGRDIFLPKENEIDGVIQKPTTPYSQTLAAGQAQAPSIEIASFNVELSFTGIRIYGSLRVVINGAASIITFDGRLQDLQNFSVTVATTALSIPGFTTAPIEASGSFKRVAGVNSIDFTAKIPGLQIGDLSVTDVALDLAATTTTGLTASIAGKVAVSGNQVELALSAAFNSRGELIDIQGTLGVDVSSTLSDGTLVALNGQLNLSGQSTSIVASFVGTGTYGPDAIARAAGRVEIDSFGVLTIDGLFDVSKPGSSLRLEGRLVFDGPNGTASLSAIGSGSYSGFNTAGEIVELSGTVTTTLINGVLTTTVDGSLRVGALRGDASASVVVNGATTTLDLTGRVRTGTFDANVRGTLVFSGGLVDSVALTGTLLAPAQVGDVTANGTITVTGTSRTGLVIDLGGTFVGPGVNVQGSARVALDTQGALTNLSAFVSGTLSQGGWNLSGFTGSLVMDKDGLVATGAGFIGGAGVQYGQASGSLTVLGGVPVLNLQGQASVRSGSKAVFGDFSIVNNELTMARVGLIYPPIAFDPERVWVRLQLGSTGQCTNIRVLEATFLIGLFGGGQIAANNLNCPL